MSQYYSDESHESEPHALPDLLVTQLTAREVAEQDEELIHDYMRKPQFKLASMNSRTRDAMIAREGIEGGWCWAYCMPGCLPDSSFFGPFDTEELAVADMRSQQELL